MALILVSVSSHQSPAAAQVITDGRLWTNLSVQERQGTDSPWRWSGEFVLRTRDGVDDLDVLVLRGLLGYDVTPRSSAWMGFAVVPSFPVAGGTLVEKLQAIAAAGFDGVEIFENDFLAFDGSPREVGRMVADADLKITLFQPFRDFEGMPEPQRQRTFDRAERKFDIMQELGTDLMLVCSNVSPLALGGIDRAADDFRELGGRAAKRGLRVGYEGQLRHFEIVRISEASDNPFYASRLGHIVRKLILLWRGYRFSDNEVLNCFVDEVFRGLSGELVCLFQLLADMEFYLAALQFRRVRP